MGSDRRKGWTSWQTGPAKIEGTWWQARELHFPKENVTHFYDGSELVGVEDWGHLPGRWCMKRPPADWQPRPPGYLDKAERIWTTYRLALHHRCAHARLRGWKRPVLDPVPLKCLEVVPEPPVADCGAQPSSSCNTTSACLCSEKLVPTAGTATMNPHTSRNHSPAGKAEYAATIGAMPPTPRRISAAPLQ